MFHYLRRPLKNINFMLDTELNWLTECRRTCVEQGRQYVHDVLLEGHLLLLEKLVLTLAPHLKASLRSKEGRGPLIQVSESYRAQFSSTLLVYIFPYFRPW